MEDPRGAILDDLARALEDVLAALGGDGASGRESALEAARGRADTAFEALRAADTALGDAARPYPEPLRSKVAAIQRTEALAVSLAAGAREEIATERAKLGAVRVALRRPQEVDVGAAGRSCDVKG